MFSAIGKETETTVVQHKPKRELHVRTNNLSHQQSYAAVAAGDATNHKRKADSGKKLTPTGGNKSNSGSPVLTGRTPTQAIDPMPSVNIEQPSSTTIVSHILTRSVEDRHEIKSASVSTSRVDSQTKTVGARSASAPEPLMTSLTTEHPVSIPSPEKKEEKYEILLERCTDVMREVATIFLSLIPQKQSEHIIEDPYTPSPGAVFIYPHKQLPKSADYILSIAEGYNYDANHFIHLTQMKQKVNGQLNSSKGFRVATNKATFYMVPCWEDYGFQDLETLSYDSSKEAKVGNELTQTLTLIIAKNTHACIILNDSESPYLSKEDRVKRGLELQKQWKEKFLSFIPKDANNLGQIHPNIKILTIKEWKEESTKAYEVAQATLVSHNSTNNGVLERLYKVDAEAYLTRQMRGEPSKPIDIVVPNKKAAPAPTKGEVALHLAEAYAEIAQLPEDDKKKAAEAKLYNFSMFLFRKAETTKGAANTVVLVR